jgi:hypothetical protein
MAWDDLPPVPPECAPLRVQGILAVLYYEGYAWPYSRISGLHSRNSQRDSWASKSSQDQSSCNPESRQRHKSRRSDTWPPMWWTVDCSETRVGRYMCAHAFFICPSSLVNRSILIMIDASIRIPVHPCHLLLRRPKFIFPAVR